MLYNIIIIIQVLSALAIIVLVLMQHGKGADMGAAFGAGGSSGSIFGATGSSNFLSKSTAIAAVIFFVSTLAMAYLGPYRAPVQSSIIEKLQAVPTPAPAQETAVKEAAGAAAIPGASQTVPGASGENTSK